VTPAGASQTLPLQIVAAQPNVFIVLNSDGTVNSPSNPASQGSMISILVSGAGAPAPTLPVEVDFTYVTIVPHGTSPNTATLTAAAGPDPGTVVNMLRAEVSVPNLAASVPNLCVNTQSLGSESGLRTRPCSPSGSLRNNPYKRRIVTSLKTPVTYFFNFNVPPSYSLQSTSTIWIAAAVVVTPASLLILRR
jgi:hypothetical protein